MNSNDPRRLVPLNSTPAPTIQLLSLSDDVLVEPNERDGSLVVVSRWGELVVKDPDEAVRESLRRMVLGPVTLDNVRPGGGSGADTVDDVLATLSGSVVRSLGLSDGHAPVLSAIPTSARPRFRIPAMNAGSRVRLSRFAALRPSDGELALESPVADYQVNLRQPVTTGIATALAQPRTLGELAEATGTDPAVVHGVVGYLVAGGVVLLGDDDGQFAEDTDPVWQPWTADALRFHRTSRSRQGTGTFDLPDGEPVTASPALRPPPRGERYPLPGPSEPDPAAETPLRAVLEVDHTCPDFSGEELTRDELGALLYRTARVRGPGPAHLPHGMTHEATQRPYFSVACLYELEVYLSIGQCAELPRGIYHYDPAGHALTLFNDAEADLGELLDTAKLAAGCLRRPAALLTLAARMDRMTPLAGAAYRTSLMHAGAFQQTLALVAATLGLAAHAVPVDAQASVDRVLALAWPRDVSVAECVLDRAE